MSLYRVPQVEALESRRLFAVVSLKGDVLTLKGKDGVEDDFGVRLNAEKTAVIVSYEDKDRKTIALDDFKSIKATGGTGIDEFEFPRPIKGKTVTIDAGEGDDIVRIGGGKGGKFILDMGLGNDQVFSVLDWNADPDDMRVAVAKLRVSGGAGNDEIHGRGVLNGDAGRDSLYGCRFKDFIYGGDDEDFVDGEEGNDIIFGGDGDDTLWGDEGTDSVFGDGGNDLITGGDANDSLFGNRGSDTVHGELGDDVLYGGKGEDALHTNQGVARNEAKHGGEYADIEALIAKFTRRAQKHV